jgi:hypothetical protein
VAWLVDEYGNPRVTRPESTPWVLLRRNGKAEQFEHEKLSRGIGRAANGWGTDDQARSASRWGSPQRTRSRSSG